MTPISEDSIRYTPTGREGEVGFSSPEANVPSMKWDRMSGGIWCEECEEIWCDHMQAATKDNVDSLFISAISGNLRIPMFPSISAKLWANVFIDDTVIAGARKVTYFPPGGDGDGELLCMISEGEGRNVIRLALVDQARSQYESNWSANFGAYCTSSAHDYQADKQCIAISNQPASRQMVEMWSLYQYSCCTVCLEYNSLSDDVPMLDEDFSPKARSLKEKLKANSYGSTTGASMGVGGGGSSSAGMSSHMGVGGGISWS